MSVPATAFTPARMPSAGASTSITALSVSISRRGSPLVTRSPSFLRQDTSLPVSCAISRAGITTLKAMVVFFGEGLWPSARDPYALCFSAGLDHFQHAAAGFSLGFTCSGQRAVYREIVRSGDEKFFRRKARDDFVAGRSDHDFFFNARRAPAIGRRPESFQREYHARLDLDRMVERYQATDHWFFPDREADTVAVLQRKAGFFVGESKLFCFRPYRSNLGGGAARADQFDRGIEIITAALVGVDHGVRTIPNGEAAVITGAISHVRMENVVVDGVARAEHAIGKHMRMRIAAFAGNGIHSFNIFRTQIVENFADQTHGFVLAHPGFHGSVQLIVGSVDHHGRSVEQLNLILGFNNACVGHELLSVDNF